MLYRTDPQKTFGREKNQAAEMKKHPTPVPKPRSCYRNIPENEVLTHQQACNLPPPPVPPFVPPEKDEGETTDLSDSRLSVAECVRRMESLSNPGGCDTLDMSRQRLALQKVDKDDCKRPAFFQDPAAHTYERVDEWVTVRECGNYREVKTVSRQFSYDTPSNSPAPPIFRKSSVSAWGGSKQLEKQDNIKDDPDFLMEWWKTVISWEDLENQPSKDGEAELYSVKAQRIYHALLLYEQLLNKSGEPLFKNITELFSIADNLDKMSKGTKIAGITGGATSAAGGIVAVAGVVLSPFTMGASLALTAIGVGVATAGGVTGASAAIAHKVCTTMDRRKIETILQEYRTHIDDIEACLTFINRGMMSLRKHKLIAMTGVQTKAMRVAKVLDVGGDSARAMNASSKASGMLNGFALAMDFFYSGKDGQELKKGLESSFAKKIRGVAKHLQSGLNELLKVKKMYLELLKE